MEKHIIQDGGNAQTLDGSIMNNKEVVQIIHYKSEYHFGGDNSSITKLT